MGRERTASTSPPALVEVALPAQDVVPTVTGYRIDGRNPKALLLEHLGIDALIGLPKLPPAGRPDRAPGLRGVLVPGPFHRSPSRALSLVAPGVFRSARRPKIISPPNTEKSTLAGVDILIERG
ncbi:hypothetical protein GCM10009759_74830 [Kitasatospora saccharophila]|uniref:Uncharacterized protein n=1 Tax=Kitasatospora saccharophila TaxID=407973 RepID=A0ABN2YA61_9ACTN